MTTPIKTSERCPTVLEYGTVLAFHPVSRWSSQPVDIVTPERFTHWLPMPPAPKEEWEEAWDDSNIEVNISEKIYTNTPLWVLRELFKAGFDSARKAKP